MRGTKSIGHTTRGPATAVLLLGAGLYCAAVPAQAFDNVGDDPMTSKPSHEQIQRDAGSGESAMIRVGESGSAGASTRASASASASSSSSSDGKKGDCIAESRASAEATSGGDHEEDYDSDRQVSRSGDCRASSKSKARATTGGGDESSASGQSEGN